MNRERVYQHYTASVIKVIAEMYSCAHGGKLEIKPYEDYEDIRKAKPRPQKEDTRTAREFADDMWKRIKGEL